MHLRRTNDTPQGSGAMTPERMAEIRRDADAGYFSGRAEKVIRELLEALTMCHSALGERDDDNPFIDGGTDAVEPG